MKSVTKFSGMFLCAALVISTASLLRAQSAGTETDLAPKADVSRRVEGLEKQIEQLQSELATVKKQLEKAPHAAEPTTAPSESAAAPSAPAAPPSQEASASPFDSISMNGFVDGYYSYNFQHPHSGVASVPLGNSGSQLTGFRAFDAPTNALTLNMIELTLAKAPDATNSRLGFNLTFGYGNAMNVVNSTEPGGLGYAQYLKEGYLSYLAPVGRGLQIDFGKFVTQHGAEVIESKDNWNYSRGILFTYAIPFYHFGLRSKYVFNDKYNFSVFLVNGWNNIVDTNSGKTVGLQFGWNPSKKVSLVGNYMVGPEQANNNGNIRQLWDMVLIYSPTPKLSLMWNFDYGRGDRIAGVSRAVWWSGVAGYVRYSFSDNYAFAARYEYYNDPLGFTTGAAQHLNEFTTTFEHKIARHLISRLEFRRDLSNQPSLLKGSTPVTDQNTVAAGLVYVFDIHEGH